MNILNMSTGKDKKRLKNTPVLYENIKKKRGIMLTDYAWQAIQEKAVEKGLSASEYMEKLIRKHLELDCT